jgi:serine/threonine-protein kinase RsbW
LQQQSVFFVFYFVELMHRRILIIDDHDDLASHLNRDFQELGHSVEVIENRDEAVSLNHASEFHLVVTDLDNTNQALNGNGKPRVSVRAFAISAANFRGSNFDETDLKQLFEIVLKRKTEEDDSENTKHIREKIEFEFPSSLNLMQIILDYLLHRIEKVGITKSDNSHLFIALDEAYVNAVKHGNKFDANKLVRISVEVSPRKASFTFEDEGEGFDVKSIPDPLDPENLFKTSGRGVLLIHNIMDKVTYNSRGNRLTMVKKPEKV